jgi:hypothetical protein
MESSELYKHYKGLANLLKPHFYGDFSLNNIYYCHLVAAFSKCFQFNLIINKNIRNQNSFFYTPALRGICEDIITLQFLNKHSVLDKDKLLYSYMQINLVEIIENQKKFFSKNHSQQIIYTVNDSSKIKKSNLETLKNELSKIGLNKEKIFPSTSHMATDGGLFELYEYLYAATSEMVHFSPHNLMRSGWSKKKTPYHHHFNPKNFSKYYNVFNRFYGSYLFVKFTKLFKKELKLSKAVLKIVTDLESDLYLNSRWPELVTFEEMNVPEAEKIRLINMIRKVRSTKDGIGVSEENADKLIQDFVKGK